MFKNGKVGGISQWRGAVKASMEQYSATGSCFQFTVWPSRKEDLPQIDQHLSVMDYVHITLRLPNEDCRAPEMVKSIYKHNQICIKSPFLNVLRLVTIYGLLHAWVVEIFCNETPYIHRTEM